MDFVGLLADERASVPPPKMKRKGVDDMADDFSEFSLSSPARKIRRLDLRLPTILEVEESPIPQVLAPSQGSGEQLPRIIESGTSFLQNDERAIVLYTPVHLPQRLPNSFDISFNMDPDWVSEFKNRIFGSDCLNIVTNSEEESSSDAREVSSNTCLAVVPWSPSQLPEATNRMEEVANTSSEEMEVEDNASMDVEEPQLIAGPAFMAMGSVGVVDQVQQQWQQHCINPLLTTTNPTPVMWSR